MEPAPQAQIDAKNKAIKEGKYPKERYFGQARGLGIVRPPTDWEGLYEKIAEQRRSGEALDPETVARLERARDLSVGLRTQPLIAATKARQMGEEGLAEQFRRMRGSSGAAGHAITQQGATMGRQILERQGPKMAQEAVGKFSIGMKVARGRRIAESGNVLSAVARRIKDAAFRQGIALSEKQALINAGSMIAAEIARQWPDDDPDAPSGAELMGDVGTRDRGYGVYDRGPGGPDYQTGYQYGTEAYDL